MFQFRRLKRTTREVTPEGMTRPLVFTDIERETRWSLMTDGRSFVVARWSPSNYAYIDTDLLPIQGSADAFTHSMPMGIDSIIEFPTFVAKNEIEE